MLGRIVHWMAAGTIVAGSAATALAESAGRDRPVRATLIEIDGALSDAPGPFDWLSGGGEPVTLLDHVNLVNAAAERRDIEVIVVRVKDAMLAVTHVEELAVATKHARDEGKTVLFFAENYGPAELLLGAASDEAVVQLGGMISFPGMSIEQLYFADALSWLGVKADMVQVGDYKGASETMTRSGPSKEWDENISNLLDGLYGNMLTTLGSGRSLNGNDLEEAVEEAWWASADEAIEHGLIDAAVDLSDLETFIASSQDGDEVVWVEQKSKGKSAMDMGNPFAIFKILSQQPSHKAKGPTIAVLHVQGAIMDGDSSSGGLFGGSSTGSRTIRNAIKDILAEKDIGGVMLRVDSPGGSAIASEVIWQGLDRLSDEKPVWVSVGSMAASGGYYVSMGGEKIYVNPSSIVGSIGVVGGKYVMGGLYDKLNIRTHAWHRGPMAGMLSGSEEWTPAQREMVRSKMAETYDQFAGHVTQARPEANLDKIAAGRLFTGEQAIELGMADEIGSLDEAIDDLARHVGYRGDFSVMHYPGPRSLADMLEESFGGFVTAPGVAMQTQGRAGEVAAILKAAMGDAAWSALSSQIEGMFLLQKEPVLLVMPRALIVR